MHLRSLYYAATEHLATKLEISKPTLSSIARSPDTLILVKSPIGLIRPKTYLSAEIL